MKKRLWTGLLLCLVAVATMTAKSKVTNEGVYMYGIAASFMDSVVYITDIQLVEKAKIEGKTKFLEARSMYSEQLRFFLEGQGLSPYLTCAVSFDTKKPKLQKKYQKLKAKYAKQKGLTVKVMDDGHFKFEAVESLQGEGSSQEGE